MMEPYMTAAKWFGPTSADFNNHFLKESHSITQKPAYRYNWQNLRIAEWVHDNGLCPTSISAASDQALQPFVDWIWPWSDAEKSATEYEQSGNRIKTVFKKFKSRDNYETEVRKWHEVQSRYHDPRELAAAAAAPKVMVADLPPPPNEPAPASSREGGKSKGAVKQTTLGSGGGEVGYVNTQSVGSSSAAPSSFTPAPPSGPSAIPVYGQPAQDTNTTSEPEPAIEVRQAEDMPCNNDDLAQENSMFRKAPREEEAESARQIWQLKNDEITSLKQRVQVMHNKDDEITGLKQQVQFMHNQDDEIISLKQQLQSTNDQLRTAHETLRNNTTIPIVDLKQKETLITDLKRDNTTLDHNLQTKNKEVASLSTHIKGQDSKIELLTTQLRDANELELENRRRNHVDVTGLKEEIRTLAQNNKALNLDFEALERDRLRVEGMAFETMEEEARILREANEELNATVKRQEYAIGSLMLEKELGRLKADGKDHVEEKDTAKGQSAEASTFGKKAAPRAMAKAAAAVKKEMKEDVHGRDLAGDGGNATSPAGSPKQQLSEGKHKLLLALRARKSAGPSV